MANHASAVKAHRQSLLRKARTRSQSSRLRTALKSFSSLLGEGKLEEAQTSLPALYSFVDRAVRKKVLSKNAADRHKSRLTRRLTKVVTGASPEAPRSS